MAQVPENVTIFLHRSMRNWKTDVMRESLGTVNIKGGISQGESLSPLILAICMIPLSKVLRKAKTGYSLGDVKINHLLFMDNLKMFATNKNKIDILVSTVQVISQDIRMQFGVEKRGATIMKRGKLVKIEDGRLINGESIKEVG